MRGPVLQKGEHRRRDEAAGFVVLSEEISSAAGFLWQVKE